MGCEITIFTLSLNFPIIKGKWVSSLIDSKSVPVYINFGTESGHLLPRSTVSHMEVFAVSSENVEKVGETGVSGYMESGVGNSIVPGKLSDRDSLNKVGLSNVLFRKL